MRRFIPILLLLGTIYSCSKSGGTTPAPPPPPPPPGGTTGGTDPVISSVSPLVAYAGDVITITGTGFDPDMTKDTVLLGVVTSNVFTTTGFTLVIDSSKAKIISATATQIKFVSDSNFLASDGTKEIKIAVEVKVPSKKVFTSDNQLQLKDNLQFKCGHFDPYSTGCGNVTYAGDSIYIIGKGFYPPLSLVVDGKTAKFTGAPVITGSYGGWKVTGFTPIGFFGATAPPLLIPDCMDPSLLKSITITNGDGRSRTVQVAIFPGPNSQILQSGMDKAIYTLSSDNNALLTITGYALRNISFSVTGFDNSTGDTFTEKLSSIPSGWPSSFTTAIDLLALPTPKSPLGADYQVVIDGAGGGLARFTLYKKP